MSYLGPNTVPWDEVMNRRALYIRLSRIDTEHIDDWLPEISREYVADVQDILDGVGERTIVPCEGTFSHALGIDWPRGTKQHGSRSPAALLRIQKELSGEKVTRAYRKTTKGTTT